MKKFARKNSIVPVNSQSSLVVQRETKTTAATNPGDKQVKIETKSDTSRNTSRRIGSYAKLLSRSFSLLSLHPIADGMELTKHRRKTVNI